MRTVKLSMVFLFAISSHFASAQCGVIPVLCDTNADRIVDQSDIDTLILHKGTSVDPDDSKDPDRDGRVTTLDARECVALCDAGDCEVPDVLGPILPASGNNVLPAFLPLVGYQSLEFIVADIANSFTPTLPLPNNGKLVVSAAPETVSGDYNTRVVVARPINPAGFSGTVIVEWLNVSAGADTNPNWIMAHNEIIRSGHIWVGVSAQAVGVNALVNNANPDIAARYASLLHPSDSYSYDIFSKVGQLVSETASPILGGLTADIIIAVGESQSAMRLVTYIDAIHPLHNIFDGYFIHSRFGSGGPITQSPLPFVGFNAPAPVRDDLNVPVIIVQAEGDVIGSNLTSRQPASSNMIREWEMAGTSHADAYTFLGINDQGTGAITQSMFNLLRNSYNPFNCVNGVNAGPHYLVVQAAHRALDNWVRNSIPPPVAPRLSHVSSSPTVMARDQHGNALGGIRTPHVDVPLATLDIENAAPPGGFSFCRLFGRTIPFTAEKVMALYPTHAQFIQAWSDSVDDAVSTGFLLYQDGEELKAAASAWPYPN